jgi:hypothetical protein
MSHSLLLHNHIYLILILELQKIRKKGKTEKKKNLIQINPDLMKIKKILIQRQPKKTKEMNLNRPFLTLHHHINPLLDLRKRKKEQIKNLKHHLINLLLILLPIDLKERNKNKRVKKRNHLIHLNLIHHLLTLKEIKKEKKKNVNHHPNHILLIHLLLIQHPLNNLRKKKKEISIKERSHLITHLILRTIILHIHYKPQARYLQHPYAQ